MSESIYAPPEAEITAPPGDGPRYYVVSPTKFVVLTISTMGLYQVYWFYRNWQQIKLADNDDLWPVPRAIFSIFYAHSLMADIDTNFTTQGKTYEWSPNQVATIFVILAISGTVAGQVSNYVPIANWVIVSALAVPILYAIVLVNAQKAINSACDDIGGLSNSNFTAGNWLWMLFGVLIWLLNLFTVYALYANPGLLEP